MGTECSKCLGAGRFVDPVLWRSVGCGVCNGSGEEPTRLDDWTEFFGMPEEDVKNDQV